MCHLSRAARPRRPHGRVHAADNVRGRGAVRAPVPLDVPHAVGAPQQVPPLSLDRMVPVLRPTYGCSGGARHTALLRSTCPECRAQLEPLDDVVEPPVPRWVCVPWRACAHRCAIAAASARCCTLTAACFVNDYHLYRFPGANRSSGQQMRGLARFGRGLLLQRRAEQVSLPRTRRPAGDEDDTEHSVLSLGLYLGCTCQCLPTS